MARPTKFKRQYCKDLVDHMSKGGSYDTFSGYLYQKYGTEMMICRQTLYNWEVQHPEFLDTKKKAVELSHFYWEQLGLNALNDRQNFNNTVWIFNMKNRFGFGKELPNDDIPRWLKEVSENLSKPDIKEIVARSLKFSSKTEEEKDQLLNSLGESWYRNKTILND